uniref:Gamma-soluble NSF attachment protein n=1 Tax=Eutreptiella gymnastica TaxID=73025 RepID=A0A7S1NM28_9EUGL
MSDLQDVISMTFHWDSERTKALYLDVMLREGQVSDEGLFQWRAFLQNEKLLFRMFNCTDRCARLEREFHEWDSDNTGKIPAADLEDLLLKAFSLADKEHRERFADAVMMDAEGEDLTEDDLLKADYFYLMALAEEELVLQKVPPKPEITAERQRAMKVRAGTQPVGGGMKARWDAIHNGGLVAYVQGSPTLKKGIQDPCFDDPSSADALFNKGKDAITTDNGFKWWLAKELFEKAAFEYQCARNWQGTADSWLHVADCQGMLGSPVESATSLVKAADFYKKCQPMLAIKCLTEATEVYEDQKLTSMLALLNRQIAELYESQGDNDNAIAFYIEATEHYSKPDQVKQKFDLNKKIGILYAKDGRFEDGVEQFERLAHTVLEDNLSGNPVLGRLCIKDLFFYATLCKLCTLEASLSGVERLDKVIMAEKSFKKYEEMDLENIGTEIELETCKKLIKAMFKAESDQIKAALDIFHMCRTVEPWVEELFQKILKNSDDWMDKLEQGFNAK